MSRKTKKAKQRRQDERLAKVMATQPDWDGECAVCGASPIVPETGLCGPCTFGEAETIGGNW